MEMKSHGERLFCLKNVVVTCKYVFRSNFITNCPIGQRLGNYGMPRSFLRGWLQRESVGGSLHCGAGRGWARGRGGAPLRPGPFPGRGQARADLGSRSPPAAPPSCSPEGPRGPGDAAHTRRDHTGCREAWVRTSTASCPGDAGGLRPPSPQRALRFWFYAE